jgi:hypothetical protein
LALKIRRFAVVTLFDSKGRKNNNKTVSEGENELRATEEQARESEEIQ